MQHSLGRFAPSPSQGDNAFAAGRPLLGVPQHGRVNRSYSWLITGGALHAL